MAVTIGNLDHVNQSGTCLNKVSNCASKCVFNNDSVIPGIGLIFTYFDISRYVREAYFMS